MKTEAACVLLRRRDGLILGVSRRDDSTDWGLPGGKREGAESLAETAARELREETGVVVDPAALVHVFTADADGTVATTFTAGAWTGEPAARGEGAVTWVTWDDLIQGRFGRYHEALRAAVAGRAPLERGRGLRARGPGV